MRRARASWLLAGFLAAGASPIGADEARRALYREASGLMSAVAKERKAAAKVVKARAGASMVPALVDAIFFTASQNRGELYSVLESLTGESYSGYYDWIEYVGRQEDLTPDPEYPEWKAALLARIDPEYRKVFYPGAPTRIRLEEIVSGGVRFAGIPSLDHPPTIPGAQAGYLRDGEKVFGAFVNGEARAYPVRIMSWHEMANDTIGGEPVALSFCTLCGSGILYATGTPTGGRRTFETSGLLYRSNKLMVDLESYTLWSNLTGKPVLGRLANSPIELGILPSTVTTWSAWLGRHPETRVLDLKAIEREFATRFGFRYLPGAADRARSGVSFPVWVRNQRLDRDREVFALRVGGVPKAYPVDVVLEEGVINDAIGEEPVVVVGEKGGGVRAYARGDREFALGSEAGTLVDQNGKAWRLSEDKLVPLEGSGATELARIGGHVSFWFGWFAFHPQTEVYTASQSSNGG
ncbi:MAG: DUF3179 domain-containing (seleno)protein [Thermoanaerobaculia bacterium]